MRFISTLAILLLGLAVVFWAPAAKAHCPHGSDVIHCPGEPPGATLGDLDCATDEIAKYDEPNWVCAADEDTVGSLGCSSGQVARFNGSNWVCGADTTLDQTGVEALGFVTGAHAIAPGGGIGTLLDADGMTIGKVVGITSTPWPTVTILFEVSGQMILADVVTEAPSSSFNDPPGFKKNITVLFSDEDCQGAAWVWGEGNIRGRFFGEFSSAIIIGDEV